jgi:hypothetical protein
MASLTEDQKQMLNFTFGIDLDTIGESNYSVYHQTSYQVGPINLSIAGTGQIFSTEITGKLICLALHGGNQVIKDQGCLLQDGFEPAGDQDVSET